MRILLIIDSLGSGGAERSTKVTCDYLSSKNVYFEILCLDKQNIGFQAEMIKSGYPIQFLKKANFFAQASEIADHIKKGKFNVVHSVLFRSNLRTRTAKLLTNFTHLESLVNTTYSTERINDKRVNQKALKLYKILDRFSANKWVDHFHSITQTVKLHYVRELGLKPDVITVIPRGRAPFIASFDEKPRNFSSKIQLINVGRHEFQKGQLNLLKGINLLKETHPHFHLKILGRDGEMTEDLKKFIKYNDLDSYVSIEGFNTNISQQLLQADVFVFPSLYEGLGGALIEAQAAGLPVACNNIDVFHEVVKEDFNAKFFDSHDPQSISTAIKFFLEDPLEREKFGKHSLENFQIKFLEEVNNSKMLKLYKELAQI